MAAKFTNSAQEALQAAQAEAIRREHQEVHPEHLVHALVESDAGIVSNVLTLAGVNLPALKARVSEALGRIPRVSGGGAAQIHASGTFSRLMVLAEDEA